MDAKKIVIFVLKIIVLLALLLWVIMVFTDYFRVTKRQDPLFCVSKVIKDYEDGSTYICSGIGYKMIKYNRDCMPKATEFGPFLIKEKDCK